MASKPRLLRTNLDSHVKTKFFVVRTPSPHPPQMQAPNPRSREERLLAPHQPNTGGRPTTFRGDGVALKTSVNRFHLAHRGCPLRSPVLKTSGAGDQTHRVHWSRCQLKDTKKRPMDVTDLLLHLDKWALVNGRHFKCNSETHFVNFMNQRHTLTCEVIFTYRCGGPDVGLEGGFKVHRFSTQHYPDWMPSHQRLAHLAPIPDHLLQRQAALKMLGTTSKAIQTAIDRAL